VIWIYEALQVIILKSYQGSLHGKYSIRVNKQWRLLFFWDRTGGEADKVYLDNHNYR
jgi:proteic killer suppression protein